jgi:hypothetical protein
MHYTIYVISDMGHLNYCRGKGDYDHAPPHVRKRLEEIVNRYMIEEIYEVEESRYAIFYQLLPEFQSPWTYMCSQNDTLTVHFPPSTYKDNHIIKYQTNRPHHMQTVYTKKQNLLSYLTSFLPV